MNIPLYLTMVRILFIPIFMVIFFLPFAYAHLCASFVFVLAALTDALDGYLARSWQMTTKMGAFLDPVADKLLIAAAVVMVTGSHAVAGLSIASTIVVLREIAISALREWMAELGKRTSVRVSRVGKVKTAVQMLALVLLIAYTKSVMPAWVLLLGVALFYIAAALTVWSMFIYIKISWSDLTLSQEK